MRTGDSNKNDFEIVKIIFFFENKILTTGFHSNKRKKNSTAVLTVEH